MLNIFYNIIESLLKSTFTIEYKKKMQMFFFNIDFNRYPAWDSKSNTTQCLFYLHVSVLGGQPNHGWQFCFPLLLHAGGSDCRLYDGFD